ncbi:MAG: dNTP triphosphohydrolase [Calditrichaeota bacterium]|nr:MAG: dNTP triphosphohydrolase [Calditrichota bacterium]
MSVLNTALNQFYNEFDRETLSPRKREDYRTPFQKDRDRIIYSSALRRLQAKTQVFISGEYDFYRTRLTHSIEVVQIGRSICHFLYHNSSHLNETFFIDPDLVEAICFAHDLGHPPFGHSGESTLNRLMSKQGGFEGNAQTLRILTEIMYPTGSGRVGMNPTRALLDGVLKYKTLYSQLNAPERHFLYDEQKPYLDFVFADREFPEELTPGKSLNHFRSVECQIMDWADDTAYSLNDIVDGVRAKFITPYRLERWAADHPLTSQQSQWVEGIIKAIAEGEIERTFSRKIGEFINACKLEKRTNFMSDLTNRYRYELVVSPEALEEAHLYKVIASDIVFDSPQLQQLRFKWNYILEKLFLAFQENYQNIHQAKSLLPEVTHQAILEETDPRRQMRLICDHVAGMTDDFAIRTYKRFFDPDFGSIVDLI